MLQPVRRALISVSDKNGVTELARALAARGIELLSTGGTASLLRTARLLGEDAELLDALVERELQDGESIPLARLGELPPALARLVVIGLAERAVGTYVPQAGERVAEQGHELAGEEQPELPLTERAERVAEAHQAFLPGLSRFFGSNACLTRVCRS